MEKSNDLIVQSVGLGKQVPSPTGILTILEDINLGIQSRETLAVVGVSGSGKSTLLGLLAGLDTPSQGSVSLLGSDLGSLDEDGRAAIRMQRVGFVFQSFQLLDGFTALENVMLPLELAGLDKAREIASNQLQAVGLQSRLHHLPNQLSGGEQQRVAIARAFASEPEILFADEPTGNLDQKTAAQIIDLLFQMNSRNGTTLVLVTHDPAIADHCERGLVLAGGRIVDSRD